MGTLMTDWVTVENSNNQVKLFPSLFSATAMNGHKGYCNKAQTHVISCRSCMSAGTGVEFIYLLKTIKLTAQFSKIKKRFYSYTFSFIGLLIFLQL